MVKLSIIVPVYNVEKYLKRCVGSLLKQNYTDYEILLINDGSTDKSGEIAEQLGKNNKRIKVFHKSNGGLSDARNFGINHSSGEFISFVDSDDYIIENTYSNLMNEVYKNNLDIIIANAVNEYSNGTIIEKNNNRRATDSSVQSGIRYLIESIKNSSFTVVTVIGIYKRVLIQDNNLYFQKNLLHEDELWTPQILIKASRVKYVNMTFYVHYQREGSITNRKDKTKNALDQVKISYKLNNIYNDLSIDKSEKKELLNYTASLYLSAYNMGKLYNLGKKFEKDIIFLFKNSNSIKNYLKTILLTINGKLYCKVNSFTKKKGNV